MLQSTTSSYENESNANTKISFIKKIFKHSMKKLVGKMFRMIAFIDWYGHVLSITDDMLVKKISSSIADGTNRGADHGRDGHMQ